MGDSRQKMDLVIGTDVTGSLGHTTVRHAGEVQVGMTSVNPLLYPLFHLFAGRVVDGIFGQLYSFQQNPLRNNEQLECPDADTYTTLRSSSHCKKNTEHLSTCLMSTPKNGETRSHSAASSPSIATLPLRPQSFFPPSVFIDPFSCPRPGSPIPYVDSPSLTDGAATVVKGDGPLIAPAPTTAVPEVA